MTHPSDHSKQAASERRRSPWMLVAIALGVIALWYAVMLFGNRSTQSGAGEAEQPAPAAAPAGAPPGPTQPVGPARP